MDEYKEVLRRLRVRSSLIGRVINLIRERAEEVKVRYSVEISPDPGDDPFCLCAEQGKANFIVTLNPRDFPQVRLSATVVPPEHLTVPLSFAKMLFGLKPFRHRWALLAEY